jgi:hypothetical protein
MFPPGPSNILCKSVTFDATDMEFLVLNALHDTPVKFSVFKQ